MIIRLAGGAIDANQGAGLAPLALSAPRDTAYPHLPEHIATSGTALTARTVLKCGKRAGMPLLRQALVM